MRRGQINIADISYPRQPIIQRTAMDMQRFRRLYAVSAGIQISLQRIDQSLAAHLVSLRSTGPAYCDRLPDPRIERVYITEIVEGAPSRAVGRWAKSSVRACLIAPPTLSTRSSRSDADRGAALQAFKQRASQRGRVLIGLRQNRHLSGELGRDRLRFTLRQNLIDDAVSADACRRLAISDADQ